MRRHWRKFRGLEKRGGACGSERGGGDPDSNLEAEQPSIFDSGEEDTTPPPGVNVFTPVKVASASVREEVAEWNNKAREYLRDFFDGDIQHFQGTEFGDNIAKMAILLEKVLTEPENFRGVRDVQGRLQAGAIVEEDFDYLSVETFTNAPWNVLGNQPEPLKGAATSLMEELVNESKELGFEGRLKLYSTQRAKQFYVDIGFVETDIPREMELTPEAAEEFLNEQIQFRATGRRTR